MADSRGFKPINQLWQSATVPTDQDSECLYEEIPGSRDTDQPAGAAVGHAVQGEEEEEEEEEEDEKGSRGSLDFGVQVGGSGDWWGDQSGDREDIVTGGGTVPRSRSVGRNGRSGTSGGARSRSGSTDRRRPDRTRQQDIVVVGRVEEERYAARRIHVEPGTGAVLPPPAATGLKLTRGRPTSQSTVARYLHSASTNASATHHHHHHHGLHSQYPPASRTTGRQHRHHHSSRGAFSNETQEEVQEDDEATLRELLVSLQKQVSVMSMNLSAKLDELQRGDRQLETTVALCEIRTQLQELTKSVESCQSEVSEVKRDMVAIKHELDTVQQVKEEIEELREYVDRLEEHSHRRKLRLLEQGLTLFLSYAILAAVLGMLQFGYNTGVINAPEVNIENFMKDVYKDRYGEDISDDSVKTLYSVAVSIFAIGGMVGGFSGGTIANRFGRKGGLLLNNVLGIVGACLMGFTKLAESYEMLFFGRFIIGVNCGLNTSLVPMYISEIAPLNLRGGLGTVNQLAVTVGLLVSQVLGIEQILGTNEGWPVLLGLAICPAILQLLLLPVCPESPRYLLITKQWEEEARKALRRLRASNQVEEDIEEMRAEERAQQAESTISMTELICSPTLRAPLVIGVVMQLSQQLSGINAVFYYSTNLFTSSGLTDESAKFATIGIGAIMVGMTLVSIPLMDRTGRRTLHLYGLGGMFIFSIFITISFLIKEFFGYVQEMIDWMSYISVVSTLCFVVFFAVGPGSIPWMITAELFSQGPRPAAMSIAVLVNWMANFLVGIGFPSMKTSLENYTFLPFSAFLAVFWIFTYKKVPETKNKTFEEILALFRHGNDRSSLRDSRLYGSMLNCVNALEGHIPPAESAALMVAEEKPHPDSFVFAAGSERSSVAPAQPERPPPPLPPPRFPNSGV
ncbi:glucose transporter type 1 isoform X1 [Cataglyphis hispanica]|uniref:glucose transporter type 1 isoform X1 n=2 Tax=Cataglyphis hispanica TaxID=1086592 RepID=UPI00217FC3D6|nr:glucose transporter type 1 isoform X1 [Cataglyphis hispanica]XP_050456651.1 glucose transporter type 1 isoform X1 [Cataglyphis hispanica]XP_050456652.1 glucose transporter type 1 isoform X1 [Cataglyphis hispanica]XP_050456653.1 glucose transporter type 1 isoform X1 [Cataglyphis hispanica]